MSAVRLFVAMALFAFWAMSSAAAHQPGVVDEDQAAAHEVEAFREFIKRTIEKRDVRVLRAIYADNFTHTRSSGKIDGKDARIEQVLAGAPMIETAPVDEVLYRVFGDHTIIVTGKSPILETAEKRAYQVRWLVVYVKIGGDWKIGASQATRLP